MAHHDCIFCRIASGEGPAVRLFEDQHTVAFMDIRPAAPGHCLVIPRTHAANLYDIGTVDLEAVARTTRRVALAVHDALQPEGLRVGQFNGAAAGQTVFHFHNHVVPVYAGGARGFHGRDSAAAAELETLAARIRAAGLAA